VILTFGQLLTSVSPYIGRAGICDTTEPAVRLAVATLLQEYVQRAGTLKKWRLRSFNNYITLPKDLAVILKVRVNGEAQITFSKWYEFFDSASASEKSFCDSTQAGTGIRQENNNFPTIFDLPCTGGYVLAELGRKCSNKTPVGSVIIQGIADGKDVITTYKGQTIHGEKMELESGVLKRSNTFFTKITDIIKDQTEDYVKFMYQTSKEAQPKNLSLMSPKEVTAEFKRALLVGQDKCNPSKCYDVSLFGRIEVFSDYHDNDIIPLTELAGIISLAEAKQASKANNIQGATFKYQVADRVIEDANAYRKDSDNNFDMIIALSPGDCEHLL